MKKTRLEFNIKAISYFERVKKSSNNAVNLKDGRDVVMFQKTQSEITINKRRKIHRKNFYLLRDVYSFSWGCEFYLGILGDSLETSRGDRSPQNLTICSW